MKKANDSNIDKNNEEETRMFYILHSTVKAFKIKNQHIEIMWVRKYYLVARMNSYILYFIKYIYYIYIFKYI